MDNPAKALPVAKEQEAQDTRRSIRTMHKRKVSSCKMSRQSLTQSANRNEISKEENSRMNTSANYFNRSNYFNSMFSDKDLSKFDLDDREWIRRSIGEESQDESFYKDAVLPDKLATRLKNFMESDANQKSLMNSEDEMSEQKILEQGKEIVRKSGLGVDFSGKLISKEMINNALDPYKSKRKFNTSLDLGLSQENKFWLEKKTDFDKPLNQTKSQTLSDQQKFSKKSVDSQQEMTPENDIQGITSTKYSDLYCQENYQKMEKKGKSEREETEEKEQVKTENKEVKVRSGEGRQMDEQTTFDKQDESLKKSRESEHLERNDLRQLVTFESKPSSRPRIDSLEGSRTDFIDNGSFLNMGGNDSLLLGGDLEKVSQPESFER